MKIRISNTAALLRSAFTLVELLVVISVMTLLGAATLPVIGHLGAVDISMSQSRVQGVLESARQYAMAKRTYVRVGFADMTGDISGGGVSLQTIHSLSGDLSHDNTTAINDTDYWATSANPVFLGGVAINDFDTSRFSGVAVETWPTSDADRFTGFTRKSKGKDVSYRKIIQFDPQGQASIVEGELTRIAIISLVDPKKPVNPAVTLLSGVSGRIKSLRAEDL